MIFPGVATAPPPPRPSSALARAGTAALLASVALGTLGAVAAGLGPAGAAAPAALAAVAYGVARAPLRLTGAVLLFLLLGADDHGERVGQWRTPLAYVGDVLHGRLDQLGVPGLAVTGMEIALVILLALRAYRRRQGSTLDLDGHVGTARVLRGFVVLCVLAVVFSLGVGAIRGQGLVPWKVRNLLHPMLLLLFFDVAFRGPLDHALVGRVVVAAGVFRALLAFVVQRLSIAETGGKYAVATSHGDSIVFAVATYLVLVDALERPTWRRVGRAAVLLPVLVVGMLENERRIVWVMLVMMAALTYAITPMRGWKRTVSRAVIVALPLIAGYVGIGWTSSAGLFRPVQTLRSVTDTSMDHSAYWREVENWNISMSMRDHPFLGIGLGGRYTEHMYNDDISSLYREYREWPHNTVLGQLFLLGALPFVAVWAVFGAGLFLAVRAYRFARSGEDRVAALACAGAIIACHVLGYGDTGAHYPQYKIVIALAVAMAGKLAVTTGAWPDRAPRAPDVTVVTTVTALGARHRVQ